MAKRPRSRVTGLPSVAAELGNAIRGGAVRSYMTPGREYKGGTARVKLRRGVRRGTAAGPSGPEWLSPWRW
jgi:hypothetical protein